MTKRERLLIDLIKKNFHIDSILAFNLFTIILAAVDIISFLISSSLSVVPKILLSSNR